MKDLYENVEVAQPVHPQSHTSGALNGTGVNCQGFETLTVVVNIGAITASSNYSLTVKLQESSDDGSTDAYADITGATTPTVLNAGQNEPYIIEVNLSEVEQYVRPVVTAGSSSGGLVGVTFLLSNPREAPVTQVNTVVTV